ncbi:MAG: hypothetical protein NTY77_14975 [Elusimicrobia bacterium]|nr:hypothetical protein [Elusimicrobiota bacterium]
MTKFRDVVAAICLTICLAGAISLIVLVWMVPSQTPMVTNLLNILLFILSSLFAVIVGYYFARVSTSEKVDTIAEQSTEKMVHLSLQLQHLKSYLQETVEVAEEESHVNIMAEMNAYRHRVEAAAETAASLASSNETFRSDWLGIVSDSARGAIEKKYEKLREYLQDAETYERLKTERIAGGTTAAEDEKLRAVEARIEIARKQLPIQQLPFRPLVHQPAVSVEQVIKEASESHQTGTLKVKVIRPVFMATGSGKLTPPMRSVPWISHKLVSHPAELIVDNFRASPGTGTTYDFNICLKSMMFGVYLPLGEYVFEYDAGENGAGRASDATSRPSLRATSATPQG